MASAAAVAADKALSPSVVGQDHEEFNGVTSTIAPKDGDAPKTVEEEEDEEDDIQSRKRRPQASGAADVQEEGGVGDDDLFGEDEDGDGDQLPEDPTAVPREIDDRELDSGDDEGRTDRVGDAPAEEMEEREIPMMDLEIPRQAGPTPSDGETYLLKVPSFMALDPRAWKPATFQPPSTDHHTKTPTPTFSPFNTAMTTLRWRHSPSNPSSLQSNARILRWSDGSLTMQLASDPTTQYEIAGNALAPPQRNPLKPTPTSIPTSAANRTAGRHGANPSAPTEEKYDPSKDALTYLVQPVPSAESLRISHKLTAGLTIKQSANVIDDAIEKLQAGLAAATNATKVGGSQGAFLHEVDEDPELAKKRAEVAEREKQRMKKRAEAQMERERDRAGRVMGRHGMGGSRYGGGLSAGMLEDDEGGAMPTSRGTKKGSGPRRPRQRKANSEYSSDEDYGRKGFGGGQDEYDEEDDFLAPSDEEEEVGGDDDEEDIDDGIREEPRGDRGGSPKRSRADEGDGEGEADAAGEDDDEGVAAPGAGRKRRKVVEDDEDDE